jgi:hypothetical protein
LPSSSFTEKFEPVDQLREPGKGLDIMIAGHSQYRNSSPEELADRRLERSHRFEASVRTLDDITGKENRVDALLDGPLDRRQQRRLGRERSGIDALLVESLRQACGARAQMNVTDGKNRDFVDVGS